MLENKENTHRISAVRPGSIAQEAGIVPGDILLKAGGQDYLLVHSGPSNLKMWG